MSQRPIDQSDCKITAVSHGQESQTMNRLVESCTGVMIILKSFRHSDQGKWSLNHSGTLSHWLKKERSSRSHAMESLGWVMAEIDQYLWLQQVINYSDVIRRSPMTLIEFWHQKSLRKSIGKMCSNIFPTFETELELGWLAGTGVGVTDARVLAKSGRLAPTSHALEENFRWIE